jgi:hypothetical protein
MFLEPIKSVHAYSIAKTNIMIPRDSRNNSRPLRVRKHFPKPSVLRKPSNHQSEIPHRCRGIYLSSSHSLPPSIKSPKKITVPGSWRIKYSQFRRIYRSVKTFVSHIAIPRRGYVFSSTICGSAIIATWHSRGRSTRGHEQLRIACRGRKCSMVKKRRSHRRRRRLREVRRRRGDGKGHRTGNIATVSRNHCWL